MVTGEWSDESAWKVMLDAGCISCSNTVADCSRATNWLVTTQDHMKLHLSRAASKQVNQTSVMTVAPYAGPGQAEGLLE